MRLTAGKWSKALKNKLRAPKLPDHHSLLHTALIVSSNRFPNNIGTCSHHRSDHTNSYDSTAVIRIGATLHLQSTVGDYFVHKECGMQIVGARSADSAFTDFDDRPQHHHWHSRDFFSNVSNADIQVLLHFFFIHCCVSFSLLTLPNKCHL